MGVCCHGFTWSNVTRGALEPSNDPKTSPRVWCMSSFWMDVRCCRYVSNLDRSHQPTLRVVENVAVKHPLPRALSERHQEAGCGLHRDVQRVLPFHWAH